RTLSYVKGRFGDYYRNADVPEPRAADEREWGYVVFGGGMVRHKSLLDLGSLETWLADEKPQHVYYSSARYDRPSAMNMNDKEWKGADLIFDLDADHLRDADPDDSYGTMLSKCKDALLRLLAFIEDDFGFDDVQVVFSGGRGYHIHVYDDHVQRLGSDARREVVDYVRGIGFEPELAFSGETAEGSHGRKSPAKLRRLRGGAWGERVRDYILDYVDEVTDMDDDDAVERLSSFENVGSRTAENLLEAFRNQRDEIAAGNLDVVGRATSFWDSLIEEAVEETSAETDEPVTTDTRRLIRLPGSLHGGTGFEVVPLERHGVEEFDPLTDAVVFSDREQTVVADEPWEFELKGRRFNMEEGENTFPEYAAVFAMLRGDAELA
ncbi:MAG: DNA primase catalytic subunit PriS, partial [Halobacteria archaeon]|nr:DNA primase catalytic subunit PriS [Halobacteria archaeon]